MTPTFDMLADPLLRAGDDAAFPIPLGPAITVAIDNAPLVGTAMADILLGDSANNTLNGGDGEDALFGDRGNDLLLGGNHDDTLSGGADADTLDGGFGNDLMIGGSGDDVVFGGAGDDILLGGSGNDTLFGGSGNNIFVGGAGNDVFVFNADFLNPELGDWDGDGAVDDYRIERYFFNFQLYDFQITKYTDVILDYEPSDALELNSSLDGRGSSNSGLRVEGYMPAGGVNEIPADLLDLLKAIQDNDYRQFVVDLRELVTDLRTTENLHLLHGLGGFLRNFDQMSGANFFKKFDLALDRLQILDGSKLLSNIHGLLNINLNQSRLLDQSASFLSQLSKILGSDAAHFGSANVQTFLNSTLTTQGSGKLRNSLVSGLENSGINSASKFFVNSFLSQTSNHDLVGDLNSSLSSSILVSQDYGRPSPLNF